MSKVKVSIIFWGHHQVGHILVDDGFEHVPAGLISQFNTDNTLRYPDAWFKYKLDEYPLGKLAEAYIKNNLGLTWKEFRQQANVEMPIEIEEVDD